MARNENGLPKDTHPCLPCYSEGVVGGVTDSQRPSEGCSDGNSSGEVKPETNHICGGRGDCLDNMPLAYVYAPDQKFRMLYSAEDALSHGTLFEELYKPMGVYGNE